MVARTGRKAAAKKTRKVAPKRQQPVAETPHEMRTVKLERDVPMLRTACPWCNSADTRTIRTRRKPWEVTRYHKCNKCGRQYRSRANTDTEEEAEGKE